MGTFVKGEDAKNLKLLNPLDVLRYARKFI